MRFHQLSVTPTLDGGAGLIGVKLDLLTNLPTNLSNGELLINSNAHKTSRDVEEKKEEVEIEDKTVKAGVEVTYGIHNLHVHRHNRLPP
ncbi:hypothetical protein K0M31_016133 [Melipona bicolor]|uniref:Uncharacterized protein n=1 Tax=Melipona bicolor TaxID=60889 RepID=A0AA40G6L0_9HYME|nr:hypothetical protein K0M31_016133 [Melipona bicolor]